MMIQYVHDSSPRKEKIHDTAMVLKNNPWIPLTQEEYDKQEISRMSNDKHVLSYSVISGGETNENCICKEI